MVKVSIHYKVCDKNFVFESLRHISIPLEKNLCSASIKWAKRLFMDIGILMRAFEPDKNHVWSDEETNAYWDNYKGEDE